MEASTRNLDIDISAHLITDTKFVVRNSSDSAFVAGDSIDSLKDACSLDELNLVDVPELLSDELKVLIYVHDKFYHFFVDSLPFILKLHKLYPDARFVLYIKRSKQINSEPFLHVMFELLEELKIKYNVFNFKYEDKSSDACLMKNFVRTDETVFNVHAALTLQDLVETSNLLKRKYVDETIEPWRKVYIPFAGGSEDFGDVYVEDGSYPNDIRMHDELKLQTYFRSIGYEIVTPERDFSGIAEQVRFMSEVSLLCSVSSSALTNSLFMQPGGKIVELAAEVVVPSGVRDDGYVKTSQSIPLEYYPLSFAMGHSHLMVPTNRDADATISRLANLKVEL